MSEFRVTGVYPVSFKANPSVVGDTTDNFTVGAAVELRRADEVLASGVLQAIELLCPGAKVALTFSDTISQHIRVGDVVYAVEAAG
ncbi:hypothetical protein [Nocardia sp. NPDC058705]|uniref:hypothetical protein n=1 Tax=Nocardia sp. NPDC058705 TaxID=3346609 RepID=UPI0036BF6557